MEANEAAYLGPGSWPLHTRPEDVLHYSLSFQEYMFFTAFLATYTILVPYLFSPYCHSYSSHLIFLSFYTLKKALRKIPSYTVSAAMVALFRNAGVRVV
jgi:hypothetical protein